jgi:hypothetical protein
MTIRISLQQSSLYLIILIPCRRSLVEKPTLRKLAKPEMLEVREGEVEVIN